MSVRLVLCLLPAIAAFICASDLRADDAISEIQIDFARDVHSVLKRRCFECHGGEKQEGELRLDRRDDLFHSGMVVPGEPDDSELIRRIELPPGNQEIMPAVGEPLKPRTIRKLRQWIKLGAHWPEDFQPGEHWAYVPPKRPRGPKVSTPEWVRNPIDAFVLKRLDAEKLRPSPQADAAVLVRRLFLDLIGLPPTPEEVDRFVADPSEEAYQSLVSDLLSRPQFGERWARPWLDLARYADSHGFQRDNFRDVWAYRDWVIRALNQDMPFDQFTIEQIAGDLLPNATPSQKIATGFHRCTPTNVEAGSLPEETRVEQIIDRVNTTGAVWLGTTLECAQCHDHKYDPFTMKDYYGLLAFFNSTEREADRTNPKVPSSIQFKGPSMPLPDAKADARRKELQGQIDSARSQLEEIRRKLGEDLEAWALQVAAQLEDAPQTHVLQVIDFQSLGATDQHRILDDGSVLLVGEDPPANDRYTVRVKSDVAEIRALRLDALKDDSLPGGGPGRGDAERTNFVLNEFTVRESPAEGQDAAFLKFKSAKADFSQKNWSVDGAVDGKPKTGWAIAPQFAQPHWAVFVLEQPLSAGAGTELIVELVHQYGSARSIGRFRLSAITGNLDREATPAPVAKAVKKPAADWNQADRKALLDYRVQGDKHSIRVHRQIAALEKQIQKMAADTTLVMIELKKPRRSFVFERGDYRNRGESIAPGTPATLHPLQTKDEARSPKNRLDLARWLIDPANPLVARVTVNRWWSEIFGRGIVSTVEDFGVKGESPTHPDLLDWLAVEFVENGWSMKHLLRTIVSSNTYRQSSRITPDLAERDDLNLMLARGPRIRMDAEMIRDNALAASGLLSLKQFGPPIRPYQPNGIWSKVGGTQYDYKVSPDGERHRRGVYVVLKRGGPYPSFVNFDATARLACTVKRSRTNTPLQALTLLNDPVFVEAAQALAVRVLKDERFDNDASRIERAFRLCLARGPRPGEQQALQQLLTQQRAAAKTTGPETERFFQNMQAVKGISPADLSAWYSVSTVLLNLHETITKE